jgi:elongation factor 1-beta
MIWGQFVSNALLVEKWILSAPAICALSQLAMYATNATSLVLRCKMGDVIVTLQVMPSSPDANLKHIEDGATKIISDFGGRVGKVEIQPIAFGLKAVKLFFLLDENKGGTDSLEADILNVAEVESVSVVGVTRALG